MKKLIILIGIPAMFYLTACHTAEGENHADLEKFLVSSPVYKDTFTVKEYVCQIHSIKHIELRSQERGYLEDTHIDEGAFVRKGQLLFQIMPKLYKAELQKAQAEADLARIEYLNTKSLAENNVVSANELAMAKAKYDKRMAELSLAEVHLGFTEVRAPFDGIIDRFRVRPGSLIDEGELLSNLSDNSKMWVYYNVPEAEYLEYMNHMKKDSVLKVKLLLANHELFNQQGIVETIEADFNNETGNIPFRATFANPNGLLRHGETGNIQMRIDMKHAMIIPQKATFEVLDKKYVFVVDKDGVVKAKQIEVSAELPHIYVVAEGLDINDKILIDGIRKVKAGEHINVHYEDPNDVLSHLELYAE